LLFCTKASDGYYTTVDKNLAPDGGIQKCISPCANCHGGSNFCLSCIEGYAIDGSSCFSKKQIKYEMTFKYPSIFNDYDSYDIAYQKLMAKINEFKS
jgi:hypothetical protein